MKHKLKREEIDARKQAKNNLKTPQKEITSVEALRERVTWLEKFCGINSK